MGLVLWRVTRVWATTARFSYHEAPSAWDRGWQLALWMRGLRDKADLNSGPSSILHLPEADNPSENLSEW